MRTHLQILLPELEQLSLDSDVAFSVVHKRDQVTRQGHATLKQLAQQFPTLPFLLMVHPLDTVHTTITLPPLKKAQHAMAVQSRLQQMLLAPLSQHLFCYEAKADHQFDVVWTERAPLQNLLQHLNLLSVHRIMLQPASLSPTLPRAPHCYALHKTLDFSTQLQHSTPWEKRLTRPLLGALATLLILVISLYSYTQQQGNELQRLQSVAQQAVSDRWPHLPVIVAPLKQAQQALNNQALPTTAASSVSLQSMLQGSAEWLRSLAPSLQSLTWKEQTLSLLLHPDSNTQSLEGVLENTRSQLLAQGLQWHYQPQQNPLLLQLQPITP